MLLRLAPRVFSVRSSHCVRARTHPIEQRAISIEATRIKARGSSRAASIRVYQGKRLEASSVDALGTFTPQPRTGQQQRDDQRTGPHHYS